MRYRVKVVLAFAVSGTLANAAAEAQVLEEVIVTAQKREESLQDVGISVSAFSSQYVIPISPYIVVAVVRCSRACSRLLVRR